MINIDNDFDYSLKFNGTNNWIDFEKSGPTGSSPISYSFWAKTGENYSMNILSQACPSDCGTDVHLKFSTGQLNVEGLSFKNSNHFATAPFYLSDNEWHHFVFVFGDNSNFTYSNIKFYADGNEITATGHNWGGFGYDVQPYPLTIGKVASMGNYFKGELDDIAIWQKSLTAEEVLNVMNNGVNSVTDQLVHYWNFNSGNGNTVEDQIGTNNGSITGASWTIR